MMYWVIGVSILIITNTNYVLSIDDGQQTLQENAIDNSDQQNTLENRLKLIQLAHSYGLLLKDKNQNNKIDPLFEEDQLQWMESMPYSSIHNRLLNEYPKISPLKRAGYMTLCHFKMCNMGRRRRNTYKYLKY